MIKIKLNAERNTKLLLGKFSKRVYISVIVTSALEGG
jgi:hypothetical protein